jgi:hypothetical protein
MSLIDQLRLIRDICYTLLVASVTALVVSSIARAIGTALRRHKRIVRMSDEYRQEAERWTRLKK